MENTTNNSEYMLRARNIYKSFEDNEVLKGISLDVRRGEVLSIIGPSGSGKSTLLRCLNRLETIDKGSIEVEGKLLVKNGLKGVAEYAPNQEARKLLARMGMVFQQFNLFPHMTVLENLMEAPIQVKKQTREEIQPVAEALLQKVGLYEKRDAYPSRLSGGQQQRVAIARALAMKPDIILCYDQEPDTVKDSTKKAAAQGTKITFFACAAADCVNNEDYFGVVSGDNYTMGYLSGKRIAEAIGGEGEVAVVPTNFMSNDMRTRYEGALAALGEYEGITLITDQSSGFSTEECADLGEQIIMAHPDLKGYWGQWDELSVAAVSAMRSLGFEVVGSGPDLASSNTAANMAADGGFVGTGAFSAYSLGVGGGLCAVAAQAGKTVPDQVTIPIVEVTKENLLDTYFMLFHEDLPKQVIKMLS